ncbi:TetR/AcrR family transcriptional regulator [Pelagicoccus sp. SDUM812003]|uniref:TetR/AcrR family transcriptional regulator n=1 Tax=Pelagicoccus sp. SDUM812003 TaxID=3041267 RepID=UPI00280DBC9A|nr:TetR/AcrR family transcriptional regulator [Pelagicoccus sp. SDUM812003]MDQ8205108.1 TetR/AcrR family transcriptional regulator [Pelagicoccus sp. SDUM812003]
MRTVDPALLNERRRQILDAALICFREKGFHGAAMSAICKRAKMSPGHLYHYFSAKEDLIQAIVQEDSLQLEEKLSSLLQEDDLYGAMISRVHEIWDNDHRMGAALNAEVLAEASRNPRISKIIREHDARLRDKFASMIRSAQQAGNINPDIAPDGFATVIIGAINGMRMADEAGTQLDRAKATEALRELFIACLKPR